MIITLRFAIAFLLTFGIGWWLNKAESGAFWLVWSLAFLRWFLPALLPGRRDWILFIVETTLLFLGLAVGFWTARSLEDERLMHINSFQFLHPLLQWTVYGWVFCMLIGTPASHFMNRWGLKRKRHGPWCRRCGYSLIGTTGRRCPECGRSFTLEELRITEADLHPSTGMGAVTQASRPAQSK